jgi:hypothetical protein
MLFQSDVHKSDDTLFPIYLRLIEEHNKLKRGISTTPELVFSQQFPTQQSLGSLHHSNHKFRPMTVLLEISNSNKFVFNCFCRNTLLLEGYPLIMLKLKGLKCVHED